MINNINWKWIWF